MLKTMVTQLIERDRIMTTLARAKELRKVADKVVSMSKDGSPKAAERAKTWVRTDREHFKLMTVLAERYESRQGGYTRVVPTGRRMKDGAPMAYIEFIDRPGELRPARPSPNSSTPDMSHLPTSAQAALGWAKPPPTHGPSAKP